LKIIAAVLVSRTDMEAAALAGINVRTLYRLKRDPDFLVDLQAAKDAQFESAVNALRGNAIAFTDTLKTVAADAAAAPNARVRAAESGLTVLMKATELIDLAGRIAKLEAVAGRG
jgi:hypothetical protein